MASQLMDRYLTLERMMLEADERGDDDFAENLRVIMDPLWLEMTDEQHLQLNGRVHISLAVLYPITVSIAGATVVARPPLQPRPRTEQRSCLDMTDWRLDAA